MSSRIQKTNWQGLLSEFRIAFDFYGKEEQKWAEERREREVVLRGEVATFKPKIDRGTGKIRLFKRSDKAQGKKGRIAEEETSHEDSF